MTKVYVDGFKVEDITPPNSEQELETLLQNSSKVLAALEGKKIANTVVLLPTMVLISTEL